MHALCCKCHDFIATPWLVNHIDCKWFVCSLCTVQNGITASSLSSLYSVLTFLSVLYFRMLSFLLWMSMWDLYHLSYFSLTGPLCLLLSLMSFHSILCYSFNLIYILFMYTILVCTPTSCVHSFPVYTPVYNHFLCTLTSRVHSLPVYTHFLCTLLCALLCTTTSCVHSFPVYNLFLSFLLWYMFCIYIYIFIVHNVCLCMVTARCACVVVVVQLSQLCRGRPESDVWCDARNMPHRGSQDTATIWRRVHTTSIHCTTTTNRSDSKNTK